VIRVLVVDDEALFRQGIARLVDAAPDLEVVAQASDGREAVAVVRAPRPDLVLLDMQMPVMDGLSAAAEILREAPAPAVVILTSFPYDRYIVPALRLGAAGYLLKDSTVEELHRGIRAAAAGEAMLSPLVARRLLDAVGPALSGTAQAARDRVAPLSARERDVLGCVAQGMSNAEIARRLYLAEPTVKAHLAHAMTKLGVENRTQAAIVAHDAGLVAPAAP
jgi:DNA-binding NarL/FixJ family response regulator